MSFYDSGLNDGPVVGEKATDYKTKGFREKKIKSTKALL